MIGHEKSLPLCQTGTGALKHPVQKMIELRRCCGLLLGLTFDK
jgi:hypothetical protein